MKPQTLTLEKLREYALECGASDVGFCRTEDGVGGLKNAVSVVVRLSDAIVDEIDGAPTHTYFHHYRSVNALIDQILLKLGLLLQRYGYRYITIAASQSINKGGKTYAGRYSHRKAACLAGLGGIGRNNCFLHREYGARVRLGTLFCDLPMPAPQRPDADLCLGCNRCVQACPSGALTGESYREGCDRAHIIDVETCSRYMHSAFQMIGRGAVCGICMRVCPIGQRDCDTDEKERET